MKSDKKDVFSKNELLCGFDALDALWKRNFVPEKLERHYFLYWFVIYDGNIVRAAEALEVHRNTIQIHFLRFGFSQKAVHLRHFWRKLVAENKRASFESNFFKFYGQYNVKDKMSFNENKLLIRLWQTGFSFKTLSAHFMLWALRNNKSREWFQKKLGFTERHCLRVLVSCLNPKTTNGFWLAPLKPVPDEIYTERFLNRNMETQRLRRLRVLSDAG
jgi:hypothetical protein